MPCSLSDYTSMEAIAILDGFVRIDPAVPVVVIVPNCV